MLYPVVMWGATQATFVANQEAPPEAKVRAAVVFARSADGFVLANISGRGWCIPSGRLEAGETPEQTARREVYEEIGAEVGRLHPIGNFVLRQTDTGETQAVPAYVANVESMGPLPDRTESMGVRTAGLEELPSCYYTWDALLDAVFRLAADCDL